MSEMWKPKPNEVLKQWIEDISIQASDELTNWETNFVSDIEIRINNGWPLSQRQEEILERIYTEKTH